jgi:2'-hydroxyisoflavone reductase
MTTRRQLLQTALLAVGGAALAENEGALEKKLGNKHLRILILGGTGFLGPHLVERAKARGHTLTLFNRGKTAPHLFPDVEKLRGDRKGDLKSLEGRKWDAVIDDTAYVPKQVKLSADLLAPNVRHYVLVSSISVYPDDLKAGADETAPVRQLTELDTEEVLKHYGELKAACEVTAEAALPGRTLNIRPGLIVGPGDKSDRFTYWPVRFDRGGEVLAPGTGKDPVQYIDVRDLAAWMIHAVEARIVGTFNAVGPAQRQTVAELLEACRTASETPAALTWVDEKFLEEQKVYPWGDLPVWTGSQNHFAEIDSGKAVRGGLAFRPVRETARDTLAWWKTQPEERRATMHAGLKPEREREVLAAWKARQKEK